MKEHSNQYKNQLTAMELISPFIFKIFILFCCNYECFYTK